MKAILGAMVILLAVAGAEAGSGHKMPKPPKPPKPQKPSKNQPVTPPPSSGDVGGVVFSMGGFMSSGITIMQPNLTDGVVLSEVTFVANYGTGMILGGVFPPLPPSASNP